MTTKKAERSSRSPWTFLADALASVRLTVGLLGVLIPLSIVGTVIPQGLSSQEYIDRFGWKAFGVLYYLRLDTVFTSALFLLLLVALGVNVLACTLRRIREKKSHPGFILVHASLVFLLAGGLASGHGRIRGEVTLEAGQSAGFFEARGKKIPLGFEIRLTKFEVEHYQGNAEKLVIALPGGTGTYEFPVRLGEEIAVPGSPYRFKVEQYVPDFRMDHGGKGVFSASNQPNNPAILVHVSGPDTDYGEWAFAKYPDFHRKKEGGLDLRYHWEPLIPKAFRSYVDVIQQGRFVRQAVIEVNHPLKFGGLSITQENYDAVSGQWTGLGVVKDPGTRWVYLGIVVLIAGLANNIYLRPWWKKRRNL